MPWQQKLPQKKLHTDIAIGITGTTGNVDPNNAGHVYRDRYISGIRMGEGESVSI